MLMTGDEEENAVRDLGKLMSYARIIELAERLERRRGKMPGDFSPTRSESPGALDRIVGVASDPLRPS